MRSFTCFFDGMERFGGGGGTRGCAGCSPPGRHSTPTDQAVPEPTRPTPTRALDFRPTAFAPPRWLASAHAQTIGGKLLRPLPAVPLHRERIELADGDFLDLDFVDPEAVGGAPDAPLALVLHGLEGSARRAYALLTYQALARRGIQGVGLNFRGCSGELNRTARFYHSGETGDALHVLETLRARFPARRVGAVGFSLGGNVLLKLLGELGDDAAGLIDAAATVSVPFDLSAGSRGLEVGAVNRLVYTRYFMRMLRAKADAKRALLEEAIDLDTVLGTNTLRGFDEHATAPLHGFDDAEDYYARSSSRGFLPHIRTPTLLIQSGDDPFQPAGALPHDEVAANPFLIPAFTPGGGHVGFVEGTPWAPRFWAEEEAARFLGAALG